MNYTFKLSRGVARFRTASVAATFLLTLSCAGDGPNGPGSVPSSAEPTRISITPASVAMGVNQAVQFEASLDSVTSSDDFTSSPTLLSSSKGGKGRGRGRVVEIVVTPQRLTLAEGSAASFIATATLGDGSTATPTVTWTAAGGTIDASGKYTAGSVAGNYTIRATAGNGVADTAAIVVTETAPAVTQISLSPTVASLPVGDSKQFTVVGKSTDGATVPISPKYAATGGTVSSAGVYSAGETAGSFRVIATDTATGIADTSAVTVTALPSPSLQAVVLTPTTASLAPGASLQFIAAGKMSDGSTSQVGVTWSGSGGTISSAGLYTAGQSPGTFRVIATQSGGTLSDTSAIDITAPTLAPPSSCTGITVNPGQSIQAAVTANPAGTTFCLRAGTHQNQTVIPKSGDSFIGEPGTVMDGGLVTYYAFRNPSGATGSAIPSNVVIRGLKITRYKPPFQYGAIMAGGDVADQSLGWVVDNCEISYNANGAGIRFGNRMRVTNNKIHHNGEIGLVGIADSLLLENNEISYNNTQGYSLGNEAGGFKIVKTRGAVIRGNFSHHNQGPGMWTDYENIDILYENNRVEDNAGSGIFHEISERATIRNNIVRRNGFGDYDWLYGAGIQVAGSKNVEVYGNTVEENARGIIGIMQNRGSGRYGVLSLENLYVHDNTVKMTVVATTSIGHANVTGIGQDVGDLSYYTSRGNRFVDNHYILGTAARYFEWMNARKTEAEWRAYGQDVAGSFTR